MSARLKMTPLIVITLTGALVSGCSAPANDTASGSSGAEPQPSESTPAPVAQDDYPSCDEVKAALSPALDGLIELEGSENGVATGADGPALGCSWHTPETGSSIHVEEYGALSLGVSRDPEYTEDSMATLGWNVQDPRVSGAGAWALKVGGGYEPSAQLDVTGVQVVREGVVVVLTSGGAALQDVPQLAALTNDWALGAGVAVLELME
jgi:hypothetical protein